ncbi:MAG: carboxymuconolactone decarboxylase family protein [Thermodesulfobacteriota bacterium]
MSDSIYKNNIGAEMGKFKEANPELLDAWMGYHDSVFTEGALSTKEKQLCALAVAHITSCPYCIRSRTTASLKAGATEQEIVEVIYVSMRLAMGAPYAFSSIAFEALEHMEKKIPLSEGHFFTKDIMKYITTFKEESGDIKEPFEHFHEQTFTDGALTKKFKRGIVALCCALVTKCPYCIRSCVRDGKAEGVTSKEVAEAVNVSMVMAAGACWAHSSIAMETIAKAQK